MNTNTKSSYCTVDCAGRDWRLLYDISTIIESAFSAWCKYITGSHINCGGMEWENGGAIFVRLLAATCRHNPIIGYPCAAKADVRKHPTQQLAATPDTQLRIENWLSGAPFSKMKCILRSKTDITVGEIVKSDRSAEMFSFLMGNVCSRLCTVLIASDITGLVS